MTPVTGDTDQCFQDDGDWSVAAFRARQHCCEQRRTPSLTCLGRMVAWINTFGRGYGDRSPVPTSMARQEPNPTGDSIRVKGQRGTMSDEKAKSEADRVNAEEGRLDAEDLRQEADQQRHKAEDHRMLAEAARKEAEEFRVLAEDARVLREQYREGLESVRQEREALRQAAEDARKAAEESRHATIAAVAATADALSTTVAQMQFLEDARNTIRQLKTPEDVN
jgi:hypothetical protein